MAKRLGIDKAWMQRILDTVAALAARTTSSVSVPS